MSKKFSDVEIGQRFNMNGNDYRKTSDCTGKMTATGKAFYFKKADKVFLID
jgi:hypothetical protein